eukprot:g63551.t1
MCDHEFVFNQETSGTFCERCGLVGREHSLYGAGQFLVNGRMRGDKGEMTEQPRRPQGYTRLSRFREITRQVLGLRGIHQKPLVSQALLQLARDLCHKWRALYGPHENSVEGCDGNTKPLRDCLLAHCRMFLRYPDDVLSYAKVLNDLVDAVAPGAKTRHQSYTEFRQWLLGGEDAKGNLQTTFGEEVARFVLQNGLFSDPNMSAGTAKRTKENRTEKMEHQHAIHEETWLAWLDSLYQALLAESVGVHQAPDSPFLPVPDRPVWGLEAVFLMAALGMRGVEVVKFSGLEALDEKQQQERVFSSIALSRHVSQIGQAKKGRLTYDPPEDDSDEWVLTAVPKPIGMLTADTNGILQIFRHMRALIDRHLE